jgi:hypothetical protein
MSTSAGEDKDSRRWRFTLTVVAWLYIAQSVLGVITGLLGVVTMSQVDPASFSGQLATVLDPASMAAIDYVLRQAGMLNLVSTAANVVLLLASIGVLLRRKWGWYSFVIFHVATVPATFIWGLPLLEKLLGILDPTRAHSYGLLMAFLLASIPVIVVVFFLSKGIISQFERPKPAPSVEA